MKYRGFRVVEGYTSDDSDMVLLLLCVLGLHRRKYRVISHRDVQRPMQELLRDYGKHEKPPWIAGLFFRLTSTGIWETMTLPDPEDVTPGSGFSGLRPGDLCGGFSRAIYPKLDDEEFFDGLVDLLLNEFFHKDDHDSIREAAGLVREESH